jgi:hypothetical protein
VRAVFNLALGADNPVNKRTASNALLQMLNTICKRVTQIQPRLTGGSSECSSRTASEALELYRTTSGMSCYGLSPMGSNRASGTGLSNLGLLSPSVAGAAAAGAAAAGPGGGQLQSTSSDAAAAALLEDAGVAAQEGSADAAGAAAAAARAAQLRALAEQTDLQGLEAALEAAAAGDDADDADSGSCEDGTDARTAAAAAVVAAGLQTALGEAGAAGSSGGGGAHAQRQQASPVRAAAGQHVHSPVSLQHQQHQQHGGRGAPGTPHGRHSHKLSTQEKDVLLVLTAFCKLASREVPAGTSSDTVLAQGKLLALEMLAKVCVLWCGVLVWWPRGVCCAGVAW